MDRGKGCACSSLFSPSGWCIHLESTQGTEGGKYIVPTGIATGAKSQIVGRGNHGCCGSTEVPSGGVEPQGLLASAVLGDLGPPAVFHVPIHAVLCHLPQLGLSVGWRWSPRVPFLLGSKAFLKLKAVGLVFCWPIIILESFSWEVLMLPCGDPACFN